jgi:hypothetical protein
MQEGSPGVYSELQRTASPVIKASKPVSLLENIKNKFSIGKEQPLASAVRKAYTNPVSTPERGIDKEAPKPLEQMKITKIPRVLKTALYARNTGVQDENNNDYINIDDAELLNKLGFEVNPSEYLFLAIGGQKEDVYSYVEKVAGVNKNVARAIDKGESFSAEYLKELDYTVPKGYEIKGDLCCRVEKTAQSFQQKKANENTPYSQPTVENPYPDITKDLGVNAAEWAAAKASKGLADGNVAKVFSKDSTGKVVDVAKLLGKSKLWNNVAKAVPLGGAAAQTFGIHDRFNNKDYLGAAIDGVGTLGSIAQIIPHPLTKAVGLGVSAASTAANAARDINRYNNRPVEFKGTLPQLPTQPSPQHPVPIQTNNNPVEFRNTTTVQPRPELSVQPVKQAAADPSQTILITGHSGAGKSTLGKLLAEKLNLPLHRVDAHPEFKEYVTNDNEHWEKSLTPGTKEYKNYTDLVHRANKDTLANAPASSIIEGAQLGHLSPEELTKYKAHILVGGDLEQAIKQRMARSVDKAAKKGIVFSPEEMALRRLKSEAVGKYWEPGMEKFRQLPGVLRYNHTEHDPKLLITQLRKMLNKQAAADHPLKSTNIKAVGYDKKDKTLEVEFHSGGTYKYNDVPKTLFDRIKRVKSPGKFFHNHIRKDDKYEYSKLEKEADSYKLDKVDFNTNRLVIPPPTPPSPAPPPPVAPAPVPRSSVPQSSNIFSYNPHNSQAHTQSATSTTPLPKTTSTAPLPKTTSAVPLPKGGFNKMHAFNNLLGIAKDIQDEDYPGAAIGAGLWAASPLLAKNPVTAKVIPGFGVYSSAKDMKEKIDESDYTGAGLSGLNTTANILSFTPAAPFAVPASIGLTATEMIRNAYRNQMVPNPAYIQQSGGAIRDDQPLYPAGIPRMVPRYQKSIQPISPTQGVQG